MILRQIACCCIWYHY